MEDKTIQNLFEHIDLTLEETEEALRHAREKKHFAQEREKYIASVRNRPVVPLFNRDVAWRNLKKQKNAKGDLFVVDQDNEEVIKMLCLYFSGDQRFETDYPGMFLSKGILFMGPVGVGKTFLMNFFRQNPHQSFVMPSCTSIENKWVNDGGKEPYTINDIGIIDYYSSSIPAGMDEPYLHTHLGICFEDLGTRENPNQKRYGEEKNVMMEIILNRYSTKIPFNQTHFTTNLDGDGLESKYGTRVKDRLKEMCNVITLTGASRR